MPASQDTLYAKTVRGTRWVFYWRMATRLVGLASTLILIRLLDQADFGLVALATSIGTAVEQFGWIGVENAIVREPNPGRDVYDTGFTANVLRSLLTGACVALAAVPAARFFAEPRLVEIMLALAGATALAGAENIGVVEFRRDFAFHREFAYLLAPRLASAALAIGAAIVFRSYWALVVGIVSSRALRVASSYVMHPYRPRLSLRAWRTLAGYSVWTWVAGLATLLRERSDTMVIGRMLTSVQVGIYAIAFDLAALTTTEITEPLQRAAFSGFAAARNSGVPLREPLLRVMGGVALLSFPFGVGMSLMADPLLRLVIGPKWAGATIVVQILAAAGISVVPGYLCRTLLTSSGDLRRIVGITALFGVVRVGALVGLIGQFGLPGAALAAGGAMAIEGIAYVVHVFHRLRIGLAEGLRPIWRTLVATSAMAATLWSLGLGWHTSSAQTLPRLAETLASGVTIGATVYAGVVYLLWIGCGRPAGGEADAVRAAARMLGRLRRRPAL